VDELWQRFRTFWTPVLWGIGVFLAGLIVVHIVTPDPEVGTTANARLAQSIKNRSAPTPQQISQAKAGAEALEGRVASWSGLFDQRRGEGKDPDEKDLVRAAAEEALAAAILRGSGDVSEFDGDAAAAAQARARYDRAVEESLALLKTQDPNVGYSRLQAEVVGELAVRANRADVDVEPEEFGLSAVTSIDRAELPHRLLNLALIARVVDVAIRQGVRSIDSILLESSDASLGAMNAAAFLSLWPVEVTLTAEPDALRGVLAMLTDPARPTVLGSSVWKAVGKKSDLVKATMRLYSVRVRPSASLRLDSEE
jgi:hypothetical protein